MHPNLGRVSHAFLRIAIGILFMQHGLQKIYGLLGGFPSSGATVPLLSQLGVAGIFELFGGAFLILGFATRPVALVLMIEMIAAYLMVHVPQGGWPIQNQGELALVYAAVFAFLTGNGAGLFSLDESTLALRWRERRQMIDRRRQSIMVGEATGG